MYLGVIDGYPSRHLLKVGISLARSVTLAKSSWSFTISQNASLLLSLQSFSTNMTEFHMNQSKDTLNYKMAFAVFAV